MDFELFGDVVIAEGVLDQIVLRCENLVAPLELVIVEICVVECVNGTEAQSVLVIASAIVPLFVH